MVVTRLAESLTLFNKTGQLPNIYLFQVDGVGSRVAFIGCHRIRFELWEQRVLVSEAAAQTLAVYHEGIKQALKPEIQRTTSRRPLSCNRWLNRLKRQPNRQKNVPKLWQNKQGEVQTLNEQLKGNSNLG